MQVSRERLSKQVYEILKNMIADHRFEPGTRINVEQITKEVGASRTPVWEAVHRLIQEGLLENIPNRGVFMVSLTPSKALELYSVREVLEGLAARLAAEHVDEKVIKRMAKRLEEQRKVIERGDLVAYSRSDFDFHALVYEASGNRTLQEMLEAIKNKMRPISLHIRPMLEDLYEDHLGILDALRQHDADKAEKAFRRHNRHMIERIRRSVEEDQWREVEQKDVEKSSTNKIGALVTKKGIGTAK
jgi:DNA-binding GntR family transcriptional regulator